MGGIVRAVCTGPNCQQPRPYCAHKTLRCFALPAGKQMGVTPLTAGFSAPLLESLSAAWQASVQRSGTLSPLHEDVSRVLWSMGLLHRNENVICNNMFCVSMALEGDKVSSHVPPPCVSMLACGCP